MKEETGRYLSGEDSDSLIRKIVNKPEYDPVEDEEYCEEDFDLVRLKKEPFDRTHRGFGYQEMMDLYGAKFSIQKSSLATDDAIWLGIDNAEPMILASKAKAHGVETDQKNGWCPFPLPEEVMMTTRMHLNREQALELAKMLLIFAETGSIRTKD